MKRYIKDGEIWDGISIVLGDSRIWNPSEEQLVAAGYTEYVEPEPTEEELIEEAKQEKLSALVAYNESEDVNSFTVGEQQMWLDFDERSRLYKAVDAKEALGKSDMTKSWRGQDFTFSIQQWKMMLAALENYAYDCQNTTDGHIAAIELMDNVQNIKDYNYTIGYPDKLIFEV